MFRFYNDILIFFRLSSFFGAVKLLRFSVSASLLVVKGI